MVSPNMRKSHFYFSKTRKVLSDLCGTGIDEGIFFTYENIVFASKYDSGLEYLQFWLSIDYRGIFDNILKVNPPVQSMHTAAVNMDDENRETYTLILRPNN